MDNDLQYQAAAAAAARLDDVAELLLRETAPENRVEQSVVQAREKYSPRTANPCVRPAPRLSRVLPRLVSLLWSGYPTLSAS